MTPPMEQRSTENVKNSIKEAHHTSIELLEIIAEMLVDIRDNLKKY